MTGFHLAFDCFRAWRQFSRPITNRSKSKNQRTPASPFRLLKITLKTSKVIISLVTALNGKNKRGD